MWAEFKCRVLVNVVMNLTVVKSEIPRQADGLFGSQGRQRPQSGLPILLQI